jgi:hypothetical protein
LSAAPVWYHWEGSDLFLCLRVQPRASHDELLGPHGDHLRVRITAPPVEGKANEHLRRFLAQLFGVPRARVELLAGQQSRTKRWRVRAPDRLPPLIPPPPSTGRG